MSSVTDSINYTNPKKAIFFDVGNTLIYPYPSVVDVCLEILRKEKIIVDRKLLKQAVMEADYHYERLYNEDDTFWTSEKRIIKLWKNLYANAFKKIGLRKNLSILGEKVYEEFGKPHRWKLYEDVLKVLERLKKKGKIIGIISNWDTRLADIFLGLGVSNYFDFIISSANVNYHKPSPGIFELALDRANALSTEAVHIGDHYYADILGARSVGIAPILIDRLSQVDKADCPIINKLSQLAEVVAI